MTYNPARDTDEGALLPIPGSLIPEDLSGHIFITGATPRDRKNNSLFNGEGRILRLDFNKKGAVGFKASTLRTPCSFADDILGESPLNLTRFLSVGIARVSLIYGARYYHNTQPIALGKNRLLLGYDGCTPVEINPKTLKIRSYIGKYGRDWFSSYPTIDLIPHLRKFLPETVEGVKVDLNAFTNSAFPLIFSSPHPSIDNKTGDCYFPNYSTEKFSIVHWDGGSNTKSVSVIDAATGKPIQIKMSTHQTTLTENHIIVGDSAFSSPPLGMIIRSLIAPQPDYLDLYIISRKALRDAEHGGRVTANHVRLNATAVHFLADYGEDAGKIRLHVVHSSSTDAAAIILKGDVPSPLARAKAGDYPFQSTEYGGGKLAYLEGFFTPCFGHNTIATYELSEGKISSQSKLPKNQEIGSVPFFSIGEGQERKVNNIFAIELGFSPETLPKRVADAYKSRINLPESRFPSALLRYKTASATIEDRFDFDFGDLPSSPTFIPRRGSNGGTDGMDGYVGVLIWSDRKETDKSTGLEFWLFDARNLAHGPIGRFVHPNLDAVYTMHSCWLETLDEETPRAAVGAREFFDLAQRLPKFPKKVQQVVLESFEKFEAHLKT